MDPGMRRTAVCALVLALALPGCAAVRHAPVPYESEVEDIMESRETDSAGRSEAPVSSSAGKKEYIPENSVSCPPAEEPPDAGYPEGFVLLTDVVPDVILDIRYCSDYNFVGERIDGYDAPVALLTKEAAEALKKVSLELAEQGYRLKIFDDFSPHTRDFNRELGERGCISYIRMV